MKTIHIHKTILTIVEKPAPTRYSTCALTFPPLLAALIIESYPRPAPQPPSLDLLSVFRKSARLSLIYWTCIISHMTLGSLVVLLLGVAKLMRNILPKPGQSEGALVYLVLCSRLACRSNDSLTTYWLCSGLREGVCVRTDGAVA